MLRLVFGPLLDFFYSSIQFYALFSPYLSFLYLVLSQTIFDDTNAILPDLPQPPLNSKLSQSILTTQEIKSVFQILPFGKASGSNGLSTRFMSPIVFLQSVISK